MKDIEKLPTRAAVPKRTIVLAMCKAGDSTAVLGNLEGFGQMFLRKGFASVVLAPRTTIGRAEVEELINSFGKDLKSVVRALRRFGGEWRVLGERNWRSESGAA